MDAESLKRIIKEGVTTIIIIIIIIIW